MNNSTIQKFLTNLKCKLGFHKKDTVYNKHGYSIPTECNYCHKLISGKEDTGCACSSCLPVKKSTEPPLWRGLIDQIVKDLDKDSVLKISQMANPDEMYGIHFFGFGMGIRNGFNLWDKKSKEHISFVEDLGLHHADDMSGIIIAGLWYKIHGIDFDPLPFVEKYRKHWEKSGIGLDGEPLDKPYKTINSEGIVQMWICKRCKAVVKQDKKGGKCDCTISPCPWEPQPDNNKK